MTNETQNNPTPTEGALSEELKSIPDLIKDGQWNLVRDWYEAHPEEIRGHVDPSNGSTVLHAICSISSAPLSLHEFVADVWPEALTIQEYKYGATPLHLLCWTIQRHSKKIEVLLERMKPEDLMIRNRVSGSTILHSACGNHADLSVVKAIVQKYPPVLLAKTFDQHTALHALWHSHLTSIPVHMQIAHIMQKNSCSYHRNSTNDSLSTRINEHDTGKLFRRFLSKVYFLAMQSFKLSSACPNPLQAGEEKLSNYILHGLLDLKAPLNAILMALKLNPDLASYPDVEGNFPLHHAVIRRPFRVKYTKLLRELLIAYPKAAGRRNAAGDSPVHIAIRERMAWEDGLDQIVATDCSVLGLPDQQTGLHPYLLCASLGGNVAVNSVFCLLLAKPDLLMDACI
jgi:ankyrin repeat protein